MVLAHLNKPLTPPRKRVPSITAPTSDAIAHALDKTPAKRYQSYDEFIMALTAARSQLLRSQLAPPSPSKPRRAKPGNSLPVTIELDHADLDDDIRAAIEDAFRRKARKKRVKFDQFMKKARVTWRLECHFTN